MDANKKVDLEHVQCPSEANSDEYHQESSITIQHCMLLHPYHRIYMDFKMDLMTSSSFRQLVFDAMANAMQDILQWFEQTQLTYGKDFTMWLLIQHLRFISKIYKDHCSSLHDYLSDISRRARDKNDESNIPSTRIEPRSNKESPKVEITKDKGGASTKDKEVEKGERKIVEETRNSPIPTPIRSLRIHTNLVSSDSEKLQDIDQLLYYYHHHQGRYGYLFAHLRARFMPRKSFDTLADNLHDNAIANVIPSQVDASVRSYMSGHILHVHPAQSQTSSVPDQQYQLYLAMKADPQLQQQDIAIWTILMMMLILRGRIVQSDRRHRSMKLMCLESRRLDRFFKRNKLHQLQMDDDIHPKQVSLDIMKEVSLTIDDAKLRKKAGEMLRQRCTSGDEHQYHIDQMKNFLKSDIKGNSGPEKIVLSLHKFPAVIFNDDDIEERTSGWVNKCVRKFNPYARYGVEHWKISCRRFSNKETE
ncbi:hypothetical protein Tco_0340806 [Tanacetum coccineum]